MRAAKRARPIGYILIGIAALFVARAVVFVPTASACLPGFKPKPGVTNPTDNARDCEPESASGSPPAAPPQPSPPPPGGAAATPEPEPPKKKTPIVSPSEQRKKVEDRLKKRSKDGDGERSTDASGPKAPPGGKADGTDAAIDRLGKKLRQDEEGAEEPKVSAYPLSPAEVDQLIRALIVAKIIEEAERRERLALAAVVYGLVCSDPNCAERQAKLDWIAESGAENLDPFSAAFLGLVWDAAAMKQMADGIDKGQLPPPTPRPTEKRERN